MINWFGELYRVTGRHEKVITCCQMAASHRSGAFCGYEELHFLQHGAASHFCVSCSCVVETNILLVGGLGVEDQRKGLREVPVLGRVISFCGGGPKKKSADKNEVYLVMWSSQLQLPPGLLM
jgi:hypothetical protein